MNDNDPQNISHLIAGFRGSEKDQERSLQSLSEKLIFDPTIVDQLPVSELCFALLSFLDQRGSTKNIILSLQCINSILQINFTTSIFFLRFGLLQKINEILVQTNSAEAAGNCFHVLSFFSRGIPGIIPSSVDIHCFIKFMPILSRVDQRECISLLYNIIQYVPSSSMSFLFPFLIKLIQNDDEIIRNKALSIFSLIINSMPNVQLPEQAISNISSQLENAPNIESFTTLVQVLHHISKSSANSVFIAKYLPDLTTLLFTYNDSKSESLIFDILESIIPSPRLPKELWSYPPNKVPNKEDLANLILPVIIIYICEKQRNTHHSIKILAACASILKSFSCDPTLLTILLHRVYSQRCAPYIAEIASCIKSKKDVIRSGLLKNLLSMKVQKPISHWYSQKLNRLKEECKEFSRVFPASIIQSKNLGKVVQYIEKGKLFPFEFFESNLIEKVSTLYKETPVDIPEYVEELGVRCLDFLQFPKASVKSDTCTFAKMIVKFNINGPKGPTSECQVPIHSDFLMIEGWYNLRYNPGIVDRFRSAVQDNYLLQMMIEIEEDFTRSHMRFALLCRTFQVDRYYKCSFRIGNHVFSAFDNITYMLSKVCNNPEIIQDTRFELMIIHEEARRSPFIVKEMNSPPFKKVVTFLKTIEAKTTNEKFASHVFSKLDNPLLTLTLFSPSVRFMYHAPFLFSFDQRLFLFKTVAFDTVFGLKNIHEHFSKESDKKLKATLSTVKCTLTHELTFEYGCFLLSRIGCGRLRTDFVFQEDVGFGPGVTQQFFTIMSREFCKRSTKMWRDDSALNPESEFAQFEGGFFPSPLADNGLLEVLGIMCSKAVIMEKLVDIPFRSSFFKFILQGEISIEEVDPILAQSLKYPEGLYDLPFVYPGTKIELKKGGNSILVNESNADEFVKLVTDFTCGAKMLAKVAHFVKTFEMNIPIDSLKIFTPDEIVSVVCGDAVHFSKEELLKYSKIEHGYNESSPQIKYLFEIIEEMSPQEQRMLCKFITGCSRLPNGGLSGLKPPLTIAKRVPEITNNRNVNPDDYLPSVMTCTNYFKLPAYSSKEIMKAKIMTAIYECQDSFLLS